MAELDERDVPFFTDAGDSPDVPTLYATLGPYDYTSPSTRFYMDYSVSQSVSGNYSTIKLTIRCYNKGNQSSYNNDSGLQRGSVDGIDSDVVTHSADPFLPSGYDTDELRWSKSGTSVQIKHDSNGAHGSVKVRLKIDYSSVNDEFTATVSLPTIDQKPNKINSVNTDTPTVNSFRVYHGVPDNNGSSLTGYDVQWDQSSDFSSPAIKAYGTSSSPSVTVTGLNDGTRYYVRVRAKNGVGAAPWSTDGQYEDTIPAAPTALTLTAPSTTSIKATWASPSPQITGYDLQYSTSSTFASGVTTVALGVVLTHTVTGLAPGTKYYFRVRAKNASGVGAWSTTANYTTLPAVPPGLVVVASADGTTATLTFTPPSGASGVTKYTWERRKTGTTSPVATGTSTGTVATVTGLTPGDTYDWRASAWFGTYQSPWTDPWLTVIQPNPNTSPGDYFDGDTADKPDIDYTWTGTVGKSVSQAVGKNVVGWSASGGGVTVALHQTTGGAVLPDGSIAGSYAARVPFLTDTVVPTFEAGIQAAAPGWAGIEGLGLYYGSIYVYPSRPQFMAAKITYFDAALAPVASFVGEPQLVPANTWTRLIAAGFAPENAETANVRAADVDDPLWTPWLSGDTLTLDAAMISLGEPTGYFDGSTPDGLHWNYEWEGGTHESVSAAFPVTDSEYDPLEDPNCPRPPRPPRPPVITDDCITEIGTWMRYWTVIPESMVTEWLTMVPTIVLRIGSVAAHQVRIRIYPNPESLPPEEFVLADWSSEQIVSYLPPNSVMLIDGVDQRAWATVDSGDRLAADHLLYGTGGTPATWPLLSCGIGYLASFDVPADAPTGNLEVEIALTQRRS
jgi:hypothetical protein